MRTTKLLTALFCMVAIVGSTVAPATATAQAASKCYPDVPQWLDDNINLLAEDILEHSDWERVNQNLVDVVLYTIADAVGGDAAQAMRRTTPQAIGELLRTEIQVGATSTSSGSTAAFEKPGLVDLLGFAIEHGAIQQQLNDTSVTLSTSPYLLLARLKGDTPKTYQDAEFLNRINASATFLLNDKDNVLANLSRKQLTEWSVRARLSGDRSTRSKGFHQRWDDTVRPIIQESVNVFGTTATAVFNTMEDAASKTKLHGSLVDDVRNALKAEINLYLDSHRPELKRELKPENNTGLKEDMKSIILCKLRSLVYEPVHSGKITVDAGTLASGLSQLATLNQKIAAAEIAIRHFLKTFAKSGILSTFAYTNHRVAGGSDYSEFKLLFEKHVSNMDVVANAGFSIYNKPNAMLNQDKLRDFMLTFSLQGSSINPLFRGDPELATPITYTATGRYQRLMENETMMNRQPDIANFQAQVEIPITAGLSLPISYTYATATETMAKRENRFNVGLHLDINKVLSSVRAKRAQ
jgi:hypothetical protein